MVRLSVFLSVDGLSIGLRYGTWILDDRATAPNAFAEKSLLPASMAYEQMPEEAKHNDAVGSWCRPTFLRTAPCVSHHHKKVTLSLQILNASQC